MVSILEVPADKLIEKVSSKLKEMPEISPPAFAMHVKTGVHKERKPDNPDWWYVRAASVLRKVYLNPGIGVQRLRTWYGGAKNLGVGPEHHRKASGAIIRKIMQQLEAAGLLEKKQKGRAVSPKGRSLLDKTVLELLGGKKSATGKQPAKRKSGKGTGAKKTTKTTAKKSTGTKRAGKTGKSKTSKPKSGGKS